MLNQTTLSKLQVAGGRQKIADVRIHLLRNIPIQPPPFRELPKTEGALLLEIETNDGVVGWSTSGYTHHVAIDLVEKFIKPRILGEDPFRTERIPMLFDRHTWERPLGRALVPALTMIDVALWDIRTDANLCSPRAWG